MIFFALLLSGICAAVAFVAFRVFMKQSSGSTSEERKTLEAEIEAVTTELAGLLENTDQVYSRGQLEQLTQQVCEKASFIEQENTRLLDLEKRLEELQTNVEGRESTHQEMKTSKEEDELLVEEFISNYPVMSDEAISLEQQIAQHMKHIDKGVEDLSASDDIRPLLLQVQETLQLAGALMRSELMEYQSTKERLDGLQGQHGDLEDEYTRLVEQQLGG
jgi:uncharacterized protein YoxC